MTALLVAIGGAAGVLARYGIGRLVDPNDLPVATVAINVTGSALLGFLVAVGGSLAPEIRTALAVGVLGGFTTFSTFSVDVWLDLEAGRVGEALLYAAASVVLGVAAAAGGYAAGRALA